MEAAADEAEGTPPAFSLAVLAAVPRCWGQPCADLAILGQLGASHLSRLWMSAAGQPAQQEALAQRLDRSCLAVLERRPELLDVLLPHYRPVPADSAVAAVAFAAVQPGC